mmetsp:Transcript_14809/g.46561  ORF Transcript_14809/g.46561 Transcript_14809/m.46561 type:complete len:872 (-) Transcript_14809:547-3162(-)|eukprot:CAMPEP_0197395734 /NCGR_PEP_ID=MMETSP1165-20131217/7236_1 /TAXON_ID=284809 /ORGANISM="Chrysocystis fragilis, Strain CCMP3189" /LENGTH=871 /DNA_ID=CAMNT_0042921507 /DNA_START=87 /DNA_END=2702 /DNA_ORIENTATION=-
MLGGNTSGVPFHSASLYVGDLAPDASEGLLFEIFNTVGPVASIRVCRDAVTRRSLGYAYVNFHNVSDAERALDQMNYTLIKGKPCRIMWSQRDPTLRRSGVGNVFVKNLDPKIDHKALYDTFSLFGNILSCKVATDDQGRSQGYGYVHYESEEAANEAIAKIDKMMIFDREVHVGHFVRRGERTGQSDWTNLYVKNFPADWDDAKLRALFDKFGAITSCKVQPPKAPAPHKAAELDRAKKAAAKAAEDRAAEAAKAEADKQAAIEAGDESAVAAAEEILSRIAGEEAEAAEKEAAAEGSAFGWVNFEKHESALQAIESLNGATTVPAFGGDDDATTDKDATDKEAAATKDDADAKPEADGADKDEAADPTADPQENDENAPPSTGANGTDVLATKTEGVKDVIELKAPLFVGRAQKKIERERELKQKFEAAKLERIKKYQGVNLFVKNLDDAITDDILRDKFSPYGTITSARVMREPQTGASRGFGFVCFSSPDEATKAQQEMNGKHLNNKPIFVALAQRKEERGAMLQQQHAQHRSNVGAPYGMGPQGGPPGAQGMPPHLAAPANFGATYMPMMYQPGAQHPMMPPQALQAGPHGPAMQGNVRGGGYVIARGSPSRGPIGNGDLRSVGPGGMARGVYGIPPYPHMAGAPQQLGGIQHNQGGGGSNRRNRNRGSGNQQQQGAQGYKYTQNARNAQNMPPQQQMQPQQMPGGGPQQMPGGGPQQMSQQQLAASQQAAMMQQQAGGPQGPMASQQAMMAGRPPQPPMPQQQQQQQQQRAVTSQPPLTIAELANASPTLQKNMIGERLYPLIQHSQPELAGKITGMLLEMDNSELLHLLESPEALRMKVGEALDVLKQHQAQMQAAQQQVQAAE